MIHVDTSFPVDLLREEAREVEGPATKFLDQIVDEPLRAGIHVVCELLAGAELARRPSLERQRVQRLCAGVEIVYPDEQFPKVYARLLASQQRHGAQVSTMDLLIATSAVVDRGRPGDPQREGFSSRHRTRGPVLLESVARDPFPPLVARAPTYLPFWSGR